MRTSSHAKPPAPASVGALLGAAGGHVPHVTGQASHWPYAFSGHGCVLQPPAAANHAQLMMDEEERNQVGSSAHDDGVAQPPSAHVAPLTHRVVYGTPRPLLSAPSSLPSTTRSEPAPPTHEVAVVLPVHVRHSRPRTAALDGSGLYVTAPTQPLLLGPRTSTPSSAG